MALLGICLRRTPKKKEKIRLSFKPTHVINVAKSRSVKSTKLGVPAQAHPSAQESQSHLLLLMLHQTLNLMLSWFGISASAFVGNVHEYSQNLV